MARKASSNHDSSAHLGFEQKLWLAADKLRNNMVAAEYKHVVLANGRMSSNQSGARDIRKALIERPPSSIAWSPSHPVCYGRHNAVS